MKVAVKVAKTAQWPILLFMILPLVSGLEAASGTTFAWHSLAICIVPAMLFFVARNIIFQQKNSKYYAVALKYHRKYIDCLSQQQAIAVLSLCLGGAVLMLGLNHQVLVLALLSAALILDTVVYPKLIRYLGSYSILFAGMGFCLLPIIGAAFLTGSIDSSLVCESAMLFTWMAIMQIIHTMQKRQSLQLHNIPALPNTHGLKLCKLLLLSLATLLSISSVLLYVLDEAGLFYLGAAAALNIFLLRNLYHLYQEPGYTLAKKCSKVGIAYVILFMLALGVDHYISFFT